MNPHTEHKVSTQKEMKRCSLKVAKMAGLILLLLLTAPGICAQSSDKMEQLKEKLAQISLLSNQLDNQKIQAIQIRQKLYTMQKTYRSEIITEKKRERIRSYNQIKRESKIYYNLLLISELRGYIKMLNEKIRYYQIGTDKLTYLTQQAEDALRVINTLNDMKIEALLSQVELVREQYLSEAHSIIVIPEEIKFSPTQTVWNLISKGKI